MKPNIKDISDMNFLGIRTIFHPAMSCRKTPAVYKIMFRRGGGEGGGECFRDVLVEFLSCHSTRYCNGVRSFINQAHKYPKQSTTYGRKNSIALLTFHSDQPTHGIATEYGIQMPGAQDTQSEPHWNLITKCSN